MGPEPEGTPPATPALQPAVAAVAPTPADSVTELDLTAPPPPARSPWRDVILAPFRAGTLLGFGVLAFLAALVSWLEGGSTYDEHGYRLFAQAVLGVAAFVVMAVYARRVVLCVLENDRAVPWGKDEHDGATTWMHDVGSFAAVLLTSLIPALILNTIAAMLGAPEWLSGVIAFFALLAGSLHFPFASLGVVLRNGPLGAGWGRTRRAWKANAFAARTAVLPALAFLGLVLVAHELADVLVPAPLDIYRRPFVDHTPLRDFGRAFLFLLRLAAIWSAFCTFRVAGLLARDVPEIREVLA